MGLAFQSDAAGGSSLSRLMDRWWGPYELGVVASVSGRRDEAIGGDDLGSFVGCRNFHSSLSQCGWCYRVAKGVEVEMVVCIA